MAATNSSVRVAQLPAVGGASEIERRNGMRRKENPPPAATGKAGQEGESDNKQEFNPKHRPVKPTTKLAAVLAELARGRSLNRFEAERICHDHVLPSTVAEIQARGIRVDRHEETVPGHAGSVTRCARYSLAPEEAAKAAVLLGWRTWRGN